MKHSIILLKRLRNTCSIMMCQLLAGLLLVQTASAATIPVSSLSALQTAINNAAPGDVIVLNNGVYTASTDITISKQGTSTNPITITCQTIGGAEIRGTAGFSIVSPARYIIIKGFKFTHNASQATMASGTNFCRWTRNLFETPGEGENLSVNGNDHEIDYNTFQHKNALGRFITIRGTGSQIAQRIHIHHNYFFDHNPQTGNGAESVQFGLSGYSLSNTNSIVEYNLFEECEGENEMVSLKVSQVTFRYNTIRNCPAHVTLRHGNRNTVYGNYFINTPGIRYFGDDHKIFSNHFENCDPAINIGNGGGEVADGDPLTSHDRPDRVLVAYNTLVNNPRNFIMQGRTNGLGAIDNIIANNIIQGGGAAVSLSGPFTGGSYSGNILYQTSGAGNMPSSGYQTVNPLLARDATGTFHLQSGSPAINAATGSYAGIVADMDGQPRPSPLDVGADEVSSAPVIARILTPSMVGPNAGGSDPTPTCEPVSASADDGNAPANVLDNDLNTRWSANGDGQWIQFCLDDTLSVTGVQIAFYSGNTRTSTFDVLVGNDGTSWSTAAAGRVSSGTSLNPETFTFAAVSGKYVRIVGHGNSANLWNSYTEVKIQTGSGGGQIFTLTPTEDAYVRDGTNADITHGTTDPTLLITKVSPAGQLNNAREAYLLFDLASVTGNVTSATLRVYGKVDLTTVPSVPVGIFPVANTTWNESTLTWNNKPASGTTALASNIVTNVAYAYITWDLTSYIQAELAASRTKVSFVMKSGAAHDPRIFWNSSEFGSNPPQLVINTSSSSERISAAVFAKDQPVSKLGFSAFPNPFSVSNTIQFQLPKAGHTQLAVFDISGKQVAVLVNGQLAAGNHRIQFVPPQKAAGIYLLKLVYNGKTEIRRIVKE